MIEESRQCRKCYLTKPIEEFGLVFANKKYRRHRCKTCRAEQKSNWALRNPDKVKQHTRNQDEKVRNGENPHRYQAKKIRIFTDIKLRKYV